MQPFGAFVEVLPGKDGLVHVSRMASGFVSNPEDIVSLGQKIQVRVREIDDQGRISLSMILDEKDERPEDNQRPASNYHNKRSDGGPSRFPRR
ncbi:MAG: S1 RNA-binding domain-containing protein [Candidatus Shapirobacteria bacterium]|nr:S1 RNA-binding domain-containing protein [Candidatus Shapirobacteria bacterium]